MPVTADSTAPYAPPSAVVNILQRYRDHGLQTPFTSDVLARAGVSDSLIQRTLQALQTLDFIGEDGNPTEVLEALRTARQEEYQQRLAELVRAAYAEVFQFTDPTTASATAIRDAFRVYEPRGQQGRMVTLFLGLCEEAGIIENAPKRGRPPSTEIRRRQAPSGPRSSPAARSRGAAGGSPGLTGQALPGLPAPLSGLLESLPVADKGWTRDRRDQFIATFGAVLDFCIPIVEIENGVAEEEDDQ